MPSGGNEAMTTSEIKTHHAERGHAPAPETLELRARRQPVSTHQPQGGHRRCGGPALSRSPASCWWRSSRRTPARRPSGALQRRPQAHHRCACSKLPTPATTACRPGARRRRQRNGRRPDGPPARRPKLTDAGTDPAAEAERAESAASRAWPSQAREPKGVLPA